MVTSAFHVKTPLDAATWTIIYYIDGDNNLAPYYQNDLYYISSAGSDANVNVLVLFDGENTDDTHAYYASSGGLSEIQLIQISSEWTNEVNMGDPSTLIAFCDYAFLNFPAQHYMVVPQDHGGAWEGCCWDWTSGDNLDLSDLDLAFSAMKSSLGRNVDLVFFNDCEMSNLEVCYQISDSVDYVTGSETIGWTNNYDNESYDIISYIKSNPTITPVEVCQYLIQVAELVDDSYYTTQAVSAMNLTMMDDLFSHLDPVIEILANNISAYPQPVVYARQDCDYLEGSGIIDLPQFLSNLIYHSSDATLISECSQALAVLGPQAGSPDSMIISNRWTDSVRFCNGLSIFFPEAGDPSYLEYYKYGNEFASATQWANFIGLYWTHGIVPDIYEPDDVWTEASQIIDGEVQAHSIDEDGADVDWVNFTISEESFVELWTSGPSGDTVIELHVLDDGTLHFVTSNDDHIGTWSYIGMLLEAGEYYLIVYDYAMNSNISEYYLSASIRAWNPDSYEPDDYWYEAKIIEPGVSQEHTIHISADVDWVFFNVADAALIDIWTSGVSGDTYLELYLYNGYEIIMIAQDDDSGGNGMSHLKIELEPGAYYAAVHSYGFYSTIDQYFLDLSVATDAVPDPYEPDDTYDQGSELIELSDQLRSIHDNGTNEDWAYFVITQSCEVIVRTYGNLGDTVLYLYNSALEEIGHNDDYSYLWSQVMVYLDPGTYYVQVYEYGHDQDIFQYYLALRTSLVTADAYEPDDDAMSANEIVEGSTQEHTIHQFGLDQDWVYFTLNQDSLITFLTSSYSGYMWFNLYWFNGTDIELLTMSSGYLEMVLHSGTYYVGVWNENYEPVDQYSMELHVLEDAAPDDYEVDDTWDQASSLDEATYQMHSVHNDGLDEDWATFSIYETTTVMIWTDGSVGDTILELYDSTLGPVAYNDDNNNGWSMVALELVPGDYYIRVTEAGQDQDIFQYYLCMMLDSGVPDAYEPDDYYDLANELIEGVTQEHSIHNSGFDVDWVRFVVNESTLVQISTSGPYGDTCMYLFDAFIYEIAFNDDAGGTTWSTIFVQLDPGTYYVEIVEYGRDDNIDQYFIDLSFIVVEPDAFEPDDTWDQASILSEGGWQDHTIHNGGMDADWVTFTLTEVSTVDLFIAWNALQPEMFMDLYRLNGTGIELVGNYAMNIHRVLSSGTYFVKLSEVGQDDPVVQYFVALEAVPGITGIDIQSDAEMVAWAEMLGWAGNGSPEEPYVIEGYEIDALGNSFCINIAFTTLHFVIRDCDLSNATNAEIALLNLMNGRVEGCTVASDAYPYATAIDMTSCSNTDVVGNTIAVGEMGYGVFLDYCSDVEVSYNGISGPVSSFGVCLYEVSDSIFVGNQMTHSGFILQITPFPGVVIDQSNTVNGAPVIFLHDVDLMGGSIPDGAGQVLLYNVSNAVIDGQTITDCSLPIEILLCTNIIIQDCVLDGAFYCSVAVLSTNILWTGDLISGYLYAGIYLLQCPYVSVTDNVVNGYGSGAWGIYVYYCEDVMVIGNDVYGNSEYGIVLDSSNNCDIYENAVHGNGYGIVCRYGGLNVIRNNSIQDNVGYGIALLEENDIIVGNMLLDNNGATSEYDAMHVQAYDDGYGSQWDEGGSGNTWSDWQTPDDDADGVVDIPYVIDGIAMAQDDFPMVVRDVTPPNTICEILGPQGNGKWYSGAVNLELTATDADSGVKETWLSLNGGEWTLYEGSLVIDTEGEHALEFYSLDNDGNSESIQSVEFGIDTGGPNVDMAEPPGHALLVDSVKVYAVSSLAIGWTGSDPSSGIWKYEVRLGTGAWMAKGGSTNHTFAGLTTGQYVITVRAYDNAGNMVEDSITIWIDTSPPLVELNIPDDGFLAEDSATIAWTATDLPSGIDHYELWFDDAWMNIGTVLTYELEGLDEGTNEIVLKVVDGAGNVATIGFELNVDTVAPSLSVTGGPEPLTNLTTATFNISAHDETSGIQTIMVMIDGGDWNDIGAVTSYTTGPLAEGEHVIVFEAIDNAGHIKLFTCAPFSLDRTCPTCTSHHPLGSNVPIDATIELQFSENLSEAWATVDGLEVDVTLDGDTVVIEIAGGMVRGHTYTIVVGGEDLAGNLVTEVNWTFTTAVNITVHGKVVDENGDPVEGAEVWMDGEMVATTDEDGEFVLEVAPGEHILTIRADGMEDREITFDPEDGDPDPIALAALGDEGLPLMMVIGAVVVLGVVAVAAVILLRARKP